MSAPDSLGEDGEVYIVLYTIYGKLYDKHRYTKACSRNSLTNRWHQLESHEGSVRRSRKINAKRFRPLTERQRDERQEARRKQKRDEER